MPLGGGIHRISSVTLEIKIDFDVTKVSHHCVDTLSIGQTNPGPGNCGYYQPLAPNETYAGSIIFSGDFIDLGNGGFREDRSTGTSCSFGSIRCRLSGQGAEITFSAQAISYLPIINNFNSSFGFDLMAGTGWHMWQDDAPIESDGIFHFSNVVVSGFPPAVPLPASLAFLLAGLGTFGVVKRSWRL